MGFFSSKPRETKSYFPSYPLIGRNSYVSNFAGDIAEIIIYDRVLNGTERQTVEYFLGGKYPVIASLPITPTTLQAIAIAPSQVSLTWTYDLGDIATQFEIDRKIGTGAYSTIARVPHATSYLDLSGTGGVTYTYRVRAINYSGQSGYSNEESAMTPKNGDPFPVAGIRLWLKADSGTSNPLTVWTDQSGSGNHAFQSSIVNRPAIVPNAIHGRPAVHFSGNEWLNLPDVMGGAMAGEIFVVLQGENMPAQGRGLMSFGGGDASYYPWVDGQVYENFGSTVRYTLGYFFRPLDEYHVYNVSSQNGDWLARVNGLLQLQTSGNQVYFPTSPLIGRNSYVSNFLGDVVEMIIYDRALNSNEEAAVQKYLSVKYTILDPDNDGLEGDEELTIGTDPNNWDTNGNGLADGLEYFAGYDPTNLDTDGDGLANSQELVLGTDPFLADTDRDGVPDAQDAFPLDPTRWLPPLPGDPNDHTPPTIILTEPAGATLLP